MQHTSVLLTEAVSALNPRPGKCYVDATLGGGGHALQLCSFLDASNHLIGIDQDPVALAHAQARLAACATRMDFLQGNFGRLGSVFRDLDLECIDGGILLDLGVSDFQLGDAARGFSFRHAGPLDMRMDPSQTQTAADLINTLSARDLANLFFRHADEKLSRPIADAIVAARPFETTEALATLVDSIYRQKGVKAHNIHAATRVFQALRMVVNQELPMLSQFLNDLPNLLSPGARVVIITFHSLEDRLVKKAFRLAAAECLCPPKQPICTCTHTPMLRIIGKSVFPSEAEVKQNPHARSAKLRVAERI